MKVEALVKKEFEVKTIEVQAKVRYWEDGEINGVSDEDGTKTPFANGDYWNPSIDVDKGVIHDWPEGVAADLHYKVCDAGVYTLKDESGNKVIELEGYVPKTLSPGGSGYGDYIIMKIDGDGQIENWNPDLEEFFEN